MDDWMDADSRIFSIASINGFLLALQKILPVYGLQDKDFFKNRFAKLKIDFSKGTAPDEGFPYVSSQYGKFSRKILRDCFDMTVAETENDSTI